jgi:hypothetical protein
LTLSSREQSAAWRLRIGDDVFRQRRRRRNQKTQKAEGKHETSRAAAAMCRGQKIMMTWRRSARPTAAISSPTIERIKIKRSSDRLFSYKQRGSPFGGNVADTSPRAAAPPDS